MASDFKQLNVYWLPKDTENELEFEKSLNTLASRLRHELTQLRIMGNVPKICFCKGMCKVFMLIVVTHFFLFSVNKNCIVVINC